MTPIKPDPAKADLSALRALSERATTGGAFEKMEWLSACEGVVRSMLSEEGLERAARAIDTEQLAGGYCGLAGQPS